MVASPLLGGKPTTWVCGIVRTIGWVNYLDDRSQEPHRKLTAIDQSFGVAESTGQGNSKAIRDLLKIRTNDTRWTLRSQCPRSLGRHPAGLPECGTVSSWSSATSVLRGMNRS